MEQRPFGRLGQVSALTLGGGGIGQVWGATTREEAAATVREAAAAGISLFDLAPVYGHGIAEEVFGAAFGGHLPAGVRVTTKCMLGNPEPGEVGALLERSLHESMARMRVSFIDIFILHGQIVPDNAPPSESGGGRTPRRLFVEAARPVFERLVADGQAGAWGITGIGWPDALLETLAETPKPAVVQCIANLLDSAGEMHRFPGPTRARELIAAANAQGVAVMGIRAVQAGALTDAIDRVLPADSPNVIDYQRAAPFRTLAQALGESPAALAHRYALAMPGIATVVLGVKNRAELSECVAAEARGPLPPALIAQIDAAVERV